MAERWGDGPARRLDRLLESMEISNVELAAGLNLDPSTISKYRSGDREPGPYELAYMIERARGSADHVLGLKPVTIDPGVVRDAVAAAERLIEAAPQLRRAKADRPPRGQ